MQRDAGSVDAAVTAPLGTRLGGFSLQRRLGAGGMAEVFLAVRAGPNGTEYAAVKRLLPHLTFDLEFVRMFLAEVRLTEALDHPAIARVLEYGTGEGGHFLAMEYVHGHDVRELLGAVSDRGCPLGVVVGIVAELADALHYAHEFHSSDGKVTGLVHRDVSPSNVRIDHRGHVKLLDFGIARVTGQTQVTRAGQLKGKVGYMSPEQCRGETVDRRTDIFALGVLLYELLLGRRAFYGKSDLEVLARVVQGAYDKPGEIRPDVPGEVETLLERMLSPSPQGRPASAAAVATTLRSLAEASGLDTSREARAAFMASALEARPYPDLPPSPPTLHASESLAAIAVESPPPSGRGRPVLLFAAAAVVLVAVAGGGFFLGREASNTPSEARRTFDVDTRVPVESQAVETPPAPPAEAPAAEEPIAPVVIEDAEAEPMAEVDESAPAKRRRKGRRRKTAPEPSTPGMDPNALLAPSLRE